YFKSIYFREPSGVLFEIATIGPGFATDEPIEHLGETLSLPPDFEHLRPQLEPVLTPLPNPRETAAARRAGSTRSPTGYAPPQGPLPERSSSSTAAARVSTHSSRSS